MKTMLRSRKTDAENGLLQRFAEAEAPAEAPAAEAPAAEAAPAETPPAEKTVPAENGPPAGEEAPAPAEGTPSAPAGPAEDALLLQSVAAALREQSRKAEAAEIAAQWRQAEAGVKEIYPDFDLVKEARKNAEFARLLRAGVDVRRAYEAANLDAILGEAMRFAAVTAGKKTAESIAAGSARVQENSVLDRAPSLRRRDVESLTGPDILKILDEVSRGAKITF